MTNYGSFSGNPKTEWLPNLLGPDRDMQLLEKFSYTDPAGRTWTAPEGSIINGASIPMPLWSLVGSPYTDNYRNASIVHDVACEDGSDRREADAMFYSACLAGGCSKKEARVLYAGVRMGAWWKDCSEAPAIPAGTPLFCFANGPPTAPVEEEPLILNRFELIRDEINNLDADADLADVDRIIDRNMNYI